MTFIPPECYIKISSLELFVELNLRTQDELYALERGNSHNRGRKRGAH